ncbi:malonyl CoA-acyl carrier protein transacylase [Actinomycetota bacterium]|nr:malonyl CoA-acyl carrier protein transacylase [Actinomycetota bacterium]
MNQKTAWLFAGQGSQKPGMGRDFYDAYPQIRHLFDSKIDGLDLHTLCFDSDSATLSDTRNTQPCMAAFAAAVVALLTEAGLQPQAVAGLSLGEYSALHAAGVLPSDTLLELLAFRGRIMSNAAAGIKSRMTAVLGLGTSEVEAAVATIAADEQTAASAGVVVCSNYNCPGQIVIGGTQDEVLRTEALLKEQGARRLLPLNTSGPFHTPLMSSAASELQVRLSATTLGAQSVPVVFNATAATAPDSAIRDLLVRQIKSPVLFEQSIRTLQSLGITQTIEIGPGHALSGFVRKAAP